MTGPEADSLLAPFVTNRDGSIFALRNLPEEVVAVLFAYYSRSTGSLRDNLRRLLEEGDLVVGRAGTQRADDDDALTGARDRARQFHEKWVVGYGHASVAEHAVVHIAAENVSILASKVIEDARLASFTEKSTRYVVFDEDRFYTPSVFRSGEAAGVYSDVCRLLMRTYSELMPRAVEEVKRKRPRADRQSERAWETACKAGACDVLRYLLPTATLTNIGITANARVLEHLVSKLLSSPLDECRHIGAAFKEEGQKVVPTLIKYADRSDYAVGLREVLAEESALVPSAAVQNGNGSEVRLIQRPANAEASVVAALLYEHGSCSAGEARAAAEAMSPDQRRGILHRALAREGDGGRRGRHDQAPRALEHATFTYEITLDYGAYRDIQRHRMATQTRQRLTTRWGYDTPPEMEEFGFSDAFHRCMEVSGGGWDELAAACPEEAQYLLPMAWRVRVLYTWNLREIDHFVTLRSGRQGHASYRRVAQEVWRRLHEVEPVLASLISVDMADYGLSRS